MIYFFYLTCVMMFVIIIYISYKFEDTITYFYYKHHNDKEFLNLNLEYKQDRNILFLTMFLTSIVSLYCLYENLSYISFMALCFQVILIIEPFLILLFYFIQLKEILNNIKGKK